MAFCGHVASIIHRVVAAIAAAAPAAADACSVAPASIPSRKRRFACVRPAAALVLATAMLAGCGPGEDIGALMVDPARYDGYRCNDLATQWKELVAREKQLRNLIDKASEGGGGTVIGAVAYRGDYQTVLEREKVLQRAAAAQKCQLVPTYTSDQTIR
jgi:outer membrane murein-binding lipoprotein Lpp